MSEPLSLRKPGRIDWVRTGRSPTKVRVTMCTQMSEPLSQLLHQLSRLAAALIGMLVKVWDRTTSLGYGFALVRLSTMADRSHYEARDSPRHSRSATDSISRAADGATKRAFSVSTVLVYWFRW